MAVTLKTSQEIEVKINWEKLANDLKETFNIDDSVEEIEAFCCEKEKEIMDVIRYDPDIEDIFTHDLTEDISDCTD